MRDIFGPRAAVVLAAPAAMPASGVLTPAAVRSDVLIDVSGT